jgi:hypothetical protein
VVTCWRLGHAGVLKSARDHVDKAIAMIEQKWQQ